MEEPKDQEQLIASDIITDSEEGYTDRKIQAN